MYYEWRWEEVFGESLPFANYFIALHVIFIYIPIALLTVLYSIMLIKLKTQVAPGEQSTNAEEVRAERHRNVLKMAIAIVVGYVIFSVPWSIVDLLIFASGKSIPCGDVLYEVYAWLLVLVTASCAINPSICFLFSGNYRAGLKSLLNCFGAIQA